MTLFGFYGKECGHCSSDVDTSSDDIVCVSFASLLIDMPFSSQGALSLGC